MRKVKKGINPRIYRSTITYLEEKIEVYRDTYGSIDPANPSFAAARAECLSRLESCEDILCEFLDKYTSGAHSKKTDIATGELAGE